MNNFMNEKMNIIRKISKNWNNMTAYEMPKNIKFIKIDHFKNIILTDTAEISECPGYSNGTSLEMWTFMNRKGEILGNWSTCIYLVDEEILKTRSYYDKYNGRCSALSLWVDTSSPYTPGLLDGHISCNERGECVSDDYSTNAYFNNKWFKNKNLKEYVLVVMTEDESNNTTKLLVYHM